MLAPCVRKVTLWGQSRIAGKLKNDGIITWHSTWTGGSSEDVKMREREREEKIYKSDALRAEANK